MVKRIVIRADASLQIGTGHVMRCLTLADVLTEQGAECQFICREHPGNLISYIGEKGYLVKSLPVTATKPTEGLTLAHSEWLGSSQEDDVQQCSYILKSYQPDWLIVDHYALDKYWESKLRPMCKKLMVIDDLADRPHQSDLLLDQTYGRNFDDYEALVPEHCVTLCGAQYALLRPEFSQWRDYSLQRRRNGKLERVLINLGGVDKDNITSQILRALQSTPLPASCEITVVMGATAPWIEQVKNTADILPWSTDVRVGVSNMAELMSNSDLAIGAAGASSWERCCLGLPSIMVVLAQNQYKIAYELELKGASNAVSLKTITDEVLQNITKFVGSSNKLRKMSNMGSQISDGCGAIKVAAHIMGNINV